MVQEICNLLNKKVNAQLVLLHCKSVSVYLSPDIPIYILEVISRKICNCTFSKTLTTFVIYL